jgi:hypothetical protein
MSMRRLLCLAGAVCAAMVAAVGLQMAWAEMRPAHAQAGPPADPSAQMSEEELRLRIELLQRSMGFGGLFGPALQDWLNSPSAPAAAPDACGHYDEYAARQACGVGDLWAADRLQQDRASPEEQDWYNR